LHRVRAALSAHGQSGPVPDAAAASSPLAVATGADVSTGGRITAAVLALMFEEAGEARLVFTRRSVSLRSHRGEVSFPGGRLDPGEDARRAALREAHEEVALDPAQVRAEGWLHPVVTVGTGSFIMPVVGSVAARPHLVGSPAEVERVFDVPLRDLAATENFHEERWRLSGSVVPESPDGALTVWFFEVEGELIWGATARMIHELLRLVLVPLS
jgi:8-oxo-dGTP pyrophosphatase MutT (NUDIX family)